MKGRPIELLCPVNLGPCGRRAYASASRAASLMVAAAESRLIGLKKSSKKLRAVQETSYKKNQVRRVGLLIRHGG